MAEPRRSLRSRSRRGPARYPLPRRPARGDHRHDETRRPGIDFHNFALGFGFISYVVIRIAQGEWRKVHPLMYGAAAAFALYFLIPRLHDNLSWI